MIERRRIDLSGRALSAPEAEALAAALRRPAPCSTRGWWPPERAGELLAEVVALQRAHFDPAVDSYSQLLVGPGRAIFNWGTGGEEGAEPVDLGDFPRLQRLVADALALSRGLARRGEETLLSVVPSLRKTRTFPRFYHRDSHASVAEIADGGGDVAGGELLSDGLGRRARKQLPGAERRSGPTAGVGRLRRARWRPAIATSSSVRTSISGR